jgi:demethylmenaquinone methyltransferase/2-methoxy-6-polyprenyl-1,4-benzoquinol methylase
MGDLIREQIEYYRARAGEYDEWFLRQGRYDRGPEANQAWFAEVAEVRQALDSFDPKGRVLELAGGTGLWTAQLVRHAGELTVVDSSPEVLAINRQRVGSDRVQYVQADLFAWEPTECYDVVFFGFWLSHVPPERFAAFWNLVRACLRPAGRVFFVDSLYSETSTALDHQLEGSKATSVTRRLNDGRTFRIVKLFYDPAELQQHLAALGWAMTVSTTDHYFLYGSGNPIGR